MNFSLTVLLDTKLVAAASAACISFLLTLSLACNVNVDFSETRFRCGLSSDCPDEIECVGNVCGGTLDGSIADAASIDADVDARTLVCPGDCEIVTLLDACLCATATNWADAANICRSASLELLRIDDPETSDAVIAMVQSRELGSVWLGGSDAEVEGTWRWRNGDVFWDASDSADAFDDFGPNEPNDAVGGEDCLGVNNVEWNDIGCDSAFPFVCH